METRFSNLEPDPVLAGSHDGPEPILERCRTEEEERDKEAGGDADGGDRRE